jgi:hypothetical protein
MKNDVKVKDPDWQIILDNHPYKVIMTSAGPMCDKCGRGVRCWLAEDESPCKCKKKLKGWDGSQRIYVDFLGNKWASS